MADPQLWGVDFSSAPNAKKPITLARGELRGDVLRLVSQAALPRLEDFEALLREPGPWWGGFDFPFGLPRAFVQSLQLGDTLAQVVRAVHQRCASRMDFRALVDRWGATQPPGQRLLHRATDRAHPAWSSTSPLQTRYVPVGFMWFEGLRRLLDAGVHLPGLHSADPQRVAWEAYPGGLATQVLGQRSYKNSDSAERLIARKDLIHALEVGAHPLGLRLKLSHAQRDALADDPSGDRLDAVLCLVQCAWAWRHRLDLTPQHIDPLEGWILTAPPAPGLAAA